MRKRLINEANVKETLSKSDYTNDERQEILDCIKRYNSIGNQLFNEIDYNSIVDTVERIVDFVDSSNLEESGDWFDQKTLNRHVKALKENYGIFKSTLIEMQKLKHRLNSSYDEMGQVLDRYYTIEASIKESKR